MSTQEIIREFGGLSLDEKLELLDALWSRLAPGEADPGMTDDDRLALAERVSDVEADPRPPRSLEDVVNGLRNRR